MFYAAGRFVEAKGYDLLVEAFAKLPRGKLWLVGEGSEGEALRRRVQDLGLGERVWMPGFLKPEEVRGLMGLADCFVVSSRNEGGPYTLAEALRAGCPVVSTRVGYAPEFLGAGQLCESVSVEAIAEKLNLVLANPESYRGKMEPVFELAERELDVRRMVAKVLAVYEGVLARRSS